MLKPLLVLCLGNDVISDDGFGFLVAQALQDDPAVAAQAEVAAVSVAGFGLLDWLAERQRVLIVDTIQTGREPPGTLYFFPAGLLTPSRNLAGSHQINLPTALKLGELLGTAMPSQVDVLAVEASDLETLSEQVTPPVRAAVGAAIERIRRWIEENKVGE